MVDALKKLYRKTGGMLEGYDPGGTKRKKQAEHAKASEKVVNDGWKKGEGPQVIPISLPGDYGLTVGTGKNAVIYIDKDLVGSAERGDKDAIALVKITLEHEMVHWADVQDGSPQGDKEHPVEPGKDYEKDMYGEVVKRTNADELFRKQTKKW